MVGATLAAALAGSALRVALLEGCAPQDIGADDPVELRVSAITRASQQIFTRVDAWAGMTARRVSPFREMYVWDDGGAIHFDSADVGEDALGHIVENRVVQIALWQRLQNVDNVSLICPAACTGLRRERDRVHVELADGRVLAARVVVGAAGARAAIRCDSDSRLGLRSTRASGDGTARMQPSRNRVATFFIGRAARLPAAPRRPLFHRLVDHAAAGRTARGIG